MFSIRSFDKVVISFGGLWAFLPSILGKLLSVKTFIILHGTDCASLPSLHYGNLRKGYLKWVIERSYNYAYMLLPVSSSLIKVRNSYSNRSEEHDQGVLHFFPSLPTPFQVVHNGLDEQFWKAEAGVSKIENRFLSVISEGQYVLKGADLILASAHKFPECQFYIAGSHKPTDLVIPNNLHFLGKLTPKQLRTEYSKAQFYMQLSIFEGFGLSLCEAMLCNCIPIGSSVNFIPEIIGDPKFILKKMNKELLFELIDECLIIEDTNVKMEAARNRIISKFSQSRRKNALNKILQ